MNANQIQAKNEEEERQPKKEIQIRMRKEVL